MKVIDIPKSYAVVKRWKDNPNDVQVIEYFESITDAKKYISERGKSGYFEWEVMKYYANF